MSNNTAVFEVSNNVASMLLTIERDGNSRRKHGRVSPFIGKIAPVNGTALDVIATIASRALPQLTGNTLVVGLAESSLILATWVASVIPGKVELRCSTREKEHIVDARPFSEPHSHGADHFISIPKDARYTQVVIVEDEVTTGTTLQNLIEQLQELSDSFYIIALQDMRTDEDRARNLRAMEELNVTLTTVDLSSYDTPSTLIQRNVLPISLGRREDCRVESVSTMLEARKKKTFDTIYMVGECVEVPLLIWDVFKNVSLVQVTRSPWVVDNDVLYTRLDLGMDAKDVRYFLYNAQNSFPKKTALIASYPHTLNIANRLKSYLVTHNIDAEVLEVKV
jgi:orotate phosphoribosyltransferase